MLHVFSFVGCLLDVSGSVFIHSEEEKFSAKFSEEIHIILDSLSKSRNNVSMPNSPENHFDGNAKSYEGDTTSQPVKVNDGLTSVGGIVSHIRRPTFDICWHKTARSPSLI